MTEKRSTRVVNGSHRTPRFPNAGRRSMPVKASTSIAPLLPAGLVPQPG